MLQIFSHAVTPTTLSALESIQHKPRLTRLISSFKAARKT